MCRRTLPPLGALVLTVWLMAGCSGEKTAAEEAAPKPSGGTAGLILDHVTGRAQVKAGQEAMGKIRDISAERDRNLNEVLQATSGDEPGAVTE